MHPPFKYYSNETGLFSILDENMNLMANQISNEEFARLACGLLNGHFHVPVFFESEPVNLGVKGRG